MALKREEIIEALLANAKEVQARKDAEAAERRAVQHELRRAKVVALETEYARGNYQRILDAQWDRVNAERKRVEAEATQGFHRGPGDADWWGR